LIALNPIIKEGVEIGMTLKVPENGSSTSSQKRIHFNTKINFDTRKRLVFIAFNISRIESDSTNTTLERLKKISFLNMTLDFMQVL
jgi:hypothetical protein